MKYNYIIFLFGLVVILFSCGEDSVTDPIQNTTLRPMAVIFINCIPERISYPNPGIPSFYPRSINNISGTIFSDPIPEVYSVSVLDSAADPEWFGQEINEDGSVHFWQWIQNYDVPEIANCQVETSLGCFTGVENVPSKLSSFKISNGNLIEYGDSLKIEWDANGTSFFLSSISIRYEKPSGWDWYRIRDTLIFQESITLPPSLLNEVFVSSLTSFDITIYQYNGPLPVAGAQFNMDEKEKGYLYCNLGWTSFDFEILSDGSIVNLDSSIVTPSQMNFNSVNVAIIDELFGRTDSKGDR